MEEWLTYAAPESLQYFMYQKPKTAKRLYFDVIPKAVDEYHQQLRAYPGQDLKGQLNNPVYHIHGHNVPASDMIVPFAMLLNIASVSSAEDKAKRFGALSTNTRLMRRRKPIRTWMMRRVLPCAISMIS